MWDAVLEEPKEEWGAAANWPLLSIEQQVLLFPPWASVESLSDRAPLLLADAHWYWYQQNKTKRRLILQFNKRKKILYKNCANGRLAPPPRPAPIVPTILKASSQGLCRDSTASLLMNNLASTRNNLPLGWGLAWLSSYNWIDGRLYKAAKQEDKNLYGFTCKFPLK